MDTNYAIAGIRRLLAVGTMLLVSGCATSLKIPDLGAIYNQSAQYHGIDRNPVIVIPGILGSKLVDEESGTVVWGAFGRGTANPKKPMGARLAALAMEEGTPLVDLKDGVVPAGALDRLRLEFFYLPIEVSAYANILASLGAGGYRDQQLAEAGAIDYGTDHFTCFQFAYGWRRSNVENAVKLHEYILEKKAFVEQQMKERFGVKNPKVKFDIVAHSMGGLITRYYLQYGTQPLPPGNRLPELNWAGAKHISKAIFVATPSAGSSKGVRQLIEGLNLWPIAVYNPCILGTMPAIYEILPRPRHGALVDRETGERLDFYDPRVWERYGWGLASARHAEYLEVLLPDVADPEERKRIAYDHLSKCLDNARRFHEALDVPTEVPDGLSLELIAGDSEPTEVVLSAKPGAKKLKVVETSPGDGVVPRYSALMDERFGGTWSSYLQTPVDWDHVTFLFRDHLGLTKDLVFTDNILYILLEEPRN